ncbi:hypothetical protein ACFL2Z_02925 [Candidatus Eisenbacteria bacterium]|uniref:GNAT family N-acetyltransferase n=1 Tax=Eiseniibacteriota bacterium TaxID=2212470 RepID=A0ABV6YP49_UNCEI
MAVTGYSALAELEHLKDAYGGDAPGRKLDLLKVLSGASLSRARQVEALHEILCFLWAYPDSSEVLDQVEGMLQRFSRRKDLKRFRKELANSGIAGTEISFSFFWFTAEWLARRWPKQLSIDWSNFDKRNDLVEMLPLLLPYSESSALEELVLSPRGWIRRLKGPDETDAAFLIRRFKALSGGSFSREANYERLDIPIKLRAGDDTPNRTLAHYPVERIAFRTGAFSEVRESLRREIVSAPVRMRSVTPREGRKLIDLARGSMITRSRDLDAFEHASDKDVRLVDCDQGLQFACFGVVPERRLLLESVYGFLTIKNGVPIGYFLVGSIFGSSEVAFNMFETYRSAESGFIYSRAMAMTRCLFGSDTFVVPPYQLGHNNPEALQSGAWWFYYKRGFRPQDPDVRRLLRGELKKMKRNPRHRTDITTLNTLAGENMYLYLGRRRRETIATVTSGAIASSISSLQARRFGADREKGIRTCSREAARLLGLRSLRRFTSGERLAWDRWSPVIVALKGIKGWSPAQKRALVDVVRAKGGQRESRFVDLFDRHHRLQKAIARLSEEET